MLLLLLLLSCWIVTGLEVEAPPVPYYGLINSSVCLHVNSPPPYSDAQWKFKKTAIVSPSTMNPTYEKKVFFSRKNLSLCINELTHSDSGIYEVSFTGSNFHSVKESHQVTVQGKVPRPVMTVHASNGSCRITVNCSFQDDWMTSHCDADGCNTSQTSTHTFNISIFTEKRTAVCRGNNHVSTNHGSVNIEGCSSQSPVEHKEKSQKYLTFIIIIMVCSVLCVCVVVLAQRLYYRRQKSTAPSIQSQPVEPPSREEARVSTSSSCQAESCYENVEPGHTGSPTQQKGPLESPTAATIYSVPNVKIKNENNSSGDPTGQENRPSPSQPVTVHQTQQSSEADTIYCLLQRPGTSK